MKKECIVVANSVGIDRNGLALIHSPSRWTNSSRDHSVFTYYPWELAYTSALLKRDTEHRVHFVDGCLEKLTGEAYFLRVQALHPTVLLMEPSTRTWEDDAAFMQRIKKECGSRILVAGQHATAFPEQVAQVADHVFLGEYEYAVCELMQGKDPREVQGLYPHGRRPLLDVNTLPWPEDADVSRLSYGIPGEPSSEYLEIQAYATRGCPMSCNFCVCRHLYYAQPNWRPRSPEDVVNEISYLRRKYPVMEGIFFDEECHNIGKPFILALSKALIAARLNDLHIDAMCTYVTLDQEMMEAMKAAGYYLLRVGIETAGEGAAKGINLGAKFNVPHLKSVLKLAQRIGLKMYGTFTFGAPGSSKQDDEKTLQLMHDIIGDGLLWRFQTSICTPQPGTPFYTWAQEKGYLKTHQTMDYDGGNQVVLEYPDYSAEEIMTQYMKSQTFFDIALYKRFVTRLHEAKETLTAMTLQRILVLRTARMPQMEGTLSLFREVFPHAQIDMLGQKAIEDEARTYQAQGLLSHVYLYEEGFFSCEAIGEEILTTLQAQKYDLVCMVFNNLHGRGYENLDAVIAALHIPTVIALNAEGIVLTKAMIEKLRYDTHTACACKKK